MFFHFDNVSLAIAHLVSNGWNKIKNGNYVSKDGTCAACFHPVPGGDVICVQAWEIGK